MTSFKVCPNCGRQNPVDAQWCASCGANIANVAPPQQGYQQPPPNYGPQQNQQPPSYNQPPPGYGTKFCSSCGNQMDVRADVCPRCGARTVQAPPPGMMPVMPIQQKSEGLSAVLSFLIPGLGQIYNGAVGRGVAILISAIILGLFWWLIIPALVLFILWIWNIYDAYKGAQKFNQEQMARANYQYQRY